MRAAGHRGPDIELGDIDQARAWDTPFVDVRVDVAEEDRGRAVQSLAVAVNAVNRLIERLG